MLDDYLKRDRCDRARISLLEEYELVYLTGRFEVREDDPVDDELLEAIQAVGNSETEVVNYLKARSICNGR